MVRMGVFDIQIVGAESKQPFKEHTKDGKEPDVEYFVQVQKMDASAWGGDVVLKCTVDDTGLGFYFPYNKGLIEASPRQFGLFHIENGCSHFQALKFEKPKIQASNEKPTNNLLMGKIQVDMYEAFPGAQYDAETSYASSITKAEVGHQYASLAEKKSLRSAAGATTSKVTPYSKQQTHYEQGKLVDSLTVTYCTALGLIHAKVLPHPGSWQYHRLRNPAKRGQKEWDEVVVVDP